MKSWQQSHFSCGLVGPAWTQGLIEPPAGLKNMGGWTARVYTAEQQARLGVDEEGNASSAVSQPIRYTRERLITVLRNKVCTQQLQRAG